MRLKRNTLFFKLFLSFLLVVFIALLAEVVFIIVYLQDQSTKWEVQIFNDYAQAIKEEVSKRTDIMTQEEFVSICYALAVEDDKISGLLFHGESGEIFLSYGFSRTGTKLTSLCADDAASKDTQMMITEYMGTYEVSETKKKKDFESQTIRIPTLTLELSEIGENMVSEEQVVKLSLPKDVKGNQVSGLVLVTGNGERLIGIDVLTYNPATYVVTRDLFNRFGAILSISVAIAGVIAILGAWILSRKNSKYAIKLGHALNSIAGGQEDVPLPRSSTAEHISINESVHRLDLSLAKSTKGRKAWLKNISHDLKTPVSALQLLLDGMADGVFPMDKSTLASARKELGVLTARLGRMTTFSNLQSKEKAAETENFEASILQDTVIASFDDHQRIRFENSGIEINGNTQTLALALVELVANALHATEGEVTVTFRSARHIEIVNAGKLPEDVNFFEVWERGDQGRTSGGNGMGLNIVQQVMRLHNGNLTLEGEDGYVKASMEW